MLFQRKSAKEQSGNQSEPTQNSPSGMRSASPPPLQLFTSCSGPSNTQSNPGVTYLILYGSGWYRPSYKGKQYDVGKGFEKSALAMRKKIEARKSFNKATDAVVVKYTPTEKDYISAINAKYPSGLIKELFVYSHGTANSVSLGGPEKGTDDEDYRVVSAIDQNSKPKGEEELKQINPGNFTDDAIVTLRGCNLGGNNQQDAKSGANHAQYLVDELGGNRQVKAFVGGGGAEFKQNKKGQVYYDGEMVRSADRKSQKEKLTTFYPTKKP